MRDVIVAVIASMRGIAVPIVSFNWGWVEKGATSRSRTRGYFDKSWTVKLCEVVIQHPSFPVKRLPRTTAAAALSEGHPGGDIIALRTKEASIFGSTLWRMRRAHTPPSAIPYFRPRRRNRILVDDAYGRALLCYGYCVTGDLSCGRVITRVKPRRDRGRKSLPTIRDRLFRVFG